jgi:S1-C subfamily serine protease
LLDPYLVQRFKPPFADGVFVQQVQPGSLAEQSGLMAGDIIFKLNGRWVRSPEEMFGNLSTYNVGDRVRFSLVRNQARRDVFVTLSTPPVGAQQQPAQTLGVAPAGAPVLSGMPPAAGTGMTAMQTAPVAGAPAKPAKKPAPVKTEFEWQGMELQPIQSNAVGKTPAMKGKQGAVVQEMDPGLAAEKAGVLANDIILAINGLPVATNAELDKAINATVKAKSIILDVDRAGQRVLIPLK